MMKILFLEWNSFCNEDIIEAFERLGHIVFKVTFDEKKPVEQQYDSISKALDQSLCDFIFSFNYFPFISLYCMEKGLKYVSWVYDSPYINLYSYTVPNHCNYIFVFDYGVFEELRAGGICTVYYLPMAVNPRRLQSMENYKEQYKRHQCEVSFVGSLYTESKHKLYEKFENIDEFNRGYLDGIMQAQLQVYGYNFLQDMLNPDVINALEKVYPTNPNAPTIASPEYIYAEYVLNRKVTALEREKIIVGLSERYQFHLYTHDLEIKIGKAHNKGPVDYYNEMPYVFMNSKINLNITLRSIKTGIPLRAMDIMGCGGFLITNYQQEFFDYFEPEKEFVYYENLEDLKEKTNFYLQKDTIRCQIARNGCECVRREHTFEKRVKEILNVIL